MSYPIVLDTARTLAKHLANPHDPKVCHGCLGRFTYKLSNDWLEHLPLLRAECHAFFDACIATLVLLRTPDELQRLPHQLETNLRRCRFHRRDRSLYLRSGTHYLHSLFESTGHLLKVAFHLGDRPFVARVSKAGKPFGDRKGLWPSRVEQLFPHGARSAVGAIIAYCCLCISEGPLDALTAMVTVARPIVLPVLIVESLRTRLVHAILKMLEPAASGITKNAPWLLEGRRGLESAAYFLTALMSGPGALPREGAQIFLGYESTLLSVIGTVTETMADGDGFLRKLSMCCLEIAERASLALPPRVEFWRDARCRIQRTRAEALHSMIMLCLASRVCAGPGCTISTLANDGGKPFPACAKCKVPRYCSRACQRADWKGSGGGDAEPTVPHKSLCGVFVALSAQACSWDNGDAFEVTYARAEDGFDDGERKAIGTFVSALCAHVEMGCSCHCH